MRKSVVNQAISKIIYKRGRMIGMYTKEIIRRLMNKTKTYDDDKVGHEHPRWASRRP